MSKQPQFETPFDTYQAVRIIGEGGAGRVFEVRSSSGKAYALKCLAPERVSSERLKRFKNEVLFCEKQEHGNVLKVFDVGVVNLKGVKCPFYVMQLYDGTLRSRMGDIQPAGVIEVFSQLLDGVEAAHFAGVWHRDLKPENVLWDARENRFVVADFGVAHFEEEDLYTAVETRADARLANFRYSAPEQRVRGKAVDHRADIFSLGLMLNELFTKEVPQGTGYRRVKDVDGDHAYVDELVEGMIHQHSEGRPQNIETIKRELIGRKQRFVALQRFDAVSRQTVASVRPPGFSPIAFTAFDVNKTTLTLRLSGSPPSDWVEVFARPQGITKLVGYGPEVFECRGNSVSVNLAGRVDAQFVQTLVNYAKSYLDAANRDYVERLRQQALRQERSEREALERERSAAELRKNILANVKL